MICFYRYYEAKRMHDHYGKLVRDWDGDVPPMIEAQYEICGYEAEYFYDESKSLLTKIAASAIITLVIFLTCYLGDINLAKIL